MAFYEESLPIQAAAGDRRGEARAIGNIGTAWFALGEPVRAREFYERQLAITLETGDRQGEATSLFNMGEALFSLGTMEEAVLLGERALTILREIESPERDGVERTLSQWKNSIEYKE